MKILFCALAVFALFLPFPLQAGTPTEDLGKSILEEQITPPDNGWEFELRPYLWTASLSGDLGVNGVVTPVDISFGDILDNLDMALAATFLVRKGKWTFIVDGNYLKISPTIGPVPLGAIDSIGVGIKQLVWQASAAYRVFEWGENNRSYLDVTAGVRGIGMDQSINLAVNDAGLRKASESLAAQIADEVAGRAKPAVTSIVKKALSSTLPSFIANNKKVQNAVRDVVEARGQEAKAELERALAGEIERALDENIPSNASLTKWWADPVFGFAARHFFTERFYLNAYADIGGFGVASDITMGALVGPGFVVNDWLSFEFFYKYMYVDYEDDGFLYNVDLQGLFLGAVIRW